jgi:hypothetical protein
VVAYATTRRLRSRRGSGPCPDSGDPADSWRRRRCRAIEGRLRAKVSGCRRRRATTGRRPRRRWTMRGGTPGDNTSTGHSPVGRRAWCRLDSHVRVIWCECGRIGQVVAPTSWVRPAGWGLGSVQLNAAGRNGPTGIHGPERRAAPRTLEVRGPRSGPCFLRGQAGWVTPRSRG